MAQLARRREARHAVVFASLVGFDTDSDGTAETSWHCSDCTVFPVPTAPASADYTGSLLTIHFSNGFDPFTENLYVISDLGSGNAMATITVLETGSTTYDLDALAPIPEPTSVALLSAGLAGIAVLGRRR